MPVVRSRARASRARFQGLTSPKAPRSRSREFPFASPRCDTHRWNVSAHSFDIKSFAFPSVQRARECAHPLVGINARNVRERVRRPPHAASRARRRVHRPSSCVRGHDLEPRCDLANERIVVRRARLDRAPRFADDRFKRARIHGDRRRVATRDFDRSIVRPVRSLARSRVRPRARDVAHECAWW